MNEQSLLETLKLNKHLQTPEQARIFYASITALKQITNKPNLVSLLLLFNDNISYVDPMDELLAYVESFDVNLRIPALIEATIELSRVSLDWTFILYSRVLKVERERLELKLKLLSYQEEIQSCVRDILLRLPESEFYDLETKTELKEKIQFVLESS